MSKNRRVAEQSIDAEVIEALSALRGNAPDSARVFVRIIPRMPRFRKDLEAARIPFEDETKRSVDFQALCLTYNMLIYVAGADGRTAMKLMRHRDPKLTFNNYNDRTQLPKWNVVNLLPALLKGKQSDTLHSTHPPDISCPAVSPAVTDAENEDRPESLMDKGFRHDLAPSGTSWQKGKMVRAAGFEPDGPPLDDRDLARPAHASAHTDSDFDFLALVVAAWPRLSRELRQAIVAMVRSVAEGKGAAH